MPACLLTKKTRRIQPQKKYSHKLNRKTLYMYQFIIVIYKQQRSKYSWNFWELFKGKQDENNIILEEIMFLSCMTKKMVVTMWKPEDYHDDY